MERIIDVFNANKHYFHGVSELHSYQKTSLKKLFDKKNTLTIAPTGSGKSLVFQLASLYFEGMTIVISPLLALMHDLMTSSDIPSIALNSEFSFDEQRNMLKSLKSSNTKLLYLSPERLYNSLFRGSIINSNIPISMIVIDEAHCISQWGGQFRPEYGQIKKFIEFIKKGNPELVTFALTATLGEQERKDIKNEFEIEDLDIVIEDKQRKELKLNIQKVDFDKDKDTLLYDFLEKHKPKKALVYMYNRKKCERFSQKFRNKGYKSVFFHAGLKKPYKDRVYEGYKAGEFNLLFATTAFGMGINIPDIDAVIHYDIPPSIEEYYQHVGRGARKIEICPQCNCLLMWSDKNFKTWEENIKKEIFDTKKLNDAYDILAFTNQAGKIVNKNSFEIKNSGEFNLTLIRFLLEKHKVIRWIGDINGGPMQIKFQNPEEFWLKYIDVPMINIIDSFVHIYNNNGISLDSIIDYISEQDIKGNIKSMPATDKISYFEIFYDKIPDKISEQIIEEILLSVKFKLDNLKKFKEYCKYESDSFADINFDLDIEW